MDHDPKSVSGPPFLHVGAGPASMALQVLLALALLAGLYSALHEPSYILRWAGYVALGLALEGAYNILASGKFRLRSGASALTAALLVMSIPPATPFLPVLFALVLAVVVVRMPAEGSGIICFNAMLVGRLFLMLAYHEDVVNWAAPGAAADATTTATPLELYHSEEAVYALGRLLSGRIGGPWEDLYQIVPGSPGELFGPVIILIGCVLFWRGVLAWRTGAAFLAAFLVTCACLRQPLLFNLFSGAVLFAAVFIATDPKSTPVSKGGQLAAGCLAGIADALIRGCTNNSEGIVYSFLLVNLLSPALDRLAFRLRSRRLLSQKAAFERRQAEGAAA